MNESSIMRAIQLAVAKPGCRVFRNNVGTLQDRRGQYVKYGLCVGSSDLIGWTPLTVTPRMVGTQIAVFTAIEVKVPGKQLTIEQSNFIDAVIDSGGIAFKANSVLDATDALQKFKG